MTKNKFTFLKRNAENSSYKYIDKFEYITGVDSTMLYESVARDKKSSFFFWSRVCFRGNKAYFNWPIILTQKAYFGLMKQIKKRFSEF